MNSELKGNKKLVEQIAQQWFEIVLSHVNYKKNPELYPAIVVANKNKDKNLELSNAR